MTLGTGSFGRVRLVNHKVRGRAISATRMRRYRRVPAIATAAPIIARHPPKQFIEPHDISTALANLPPPPVAQATGNPWAIKILKKSEVIRLQQVSAPD